MKLKRVSFSLSPHTAAPNVAARLWIFHVGICFGWLPLPASPSLDSVTPPSVVQNNPGVLCWVSRYRQSGDSWCGGAGSSVVVAR